MIPGVASSERTVRGSVVVAVPVRRGVRVRVVIEIAIVVSTVSAVVVPSSTAVVAVVVVVVVVVVIHDQDEVKMCARRLLLRCEGE